MRHRPTKELPRRAGLAGWVLAATALAAGAGSGEASEAGAASAPVLRLAQSGSPPPQGQTLQFGTPAGEPPDQGGQTMQFGTPASEPPGQGGQTLQFGSPAAAPGQGQTPPPGTAPDSGGQGLQLGAPAPPLPAAPTMAPPEPERSVTFSVPWVRAEGGWLPDSGSRADFSGYLSGAVRAEFRPQSLPAWSLQATVRGDAYPQSGRFDDDTARLDYGESFVRYDGARTRITLGAQSVLWGRVDEIPPTDRMSVQDITRFTLDELPDRRRAVPALRIEHALDAFKLDAVLMPWFRPAELPDQDSVWFPVRQEDGRLLGIRNPFPQFGALIRNGTVGESDDFEGFGGAGVRVSRTGAGVDGALTLQRTRHSLPYYQLDPRVRAAVLQGQPLPVAIASGRGPTFREVHPLSWLFGGGLALEALGGTIRLEAAWLSDVPVTTLDARLETHPGLDWVAGYEFFPGDGNTRVTLQLSGHHVFNTPATLDRTRIFSVSGELEVPFAQELWRFNTRFSFGLNDRDIYLNPKLSYLGWEPHEVYLGAHLFSGSQRTANGFFERNDMIVLGWRAQF